MIRAIFLAIGLLAAAPASAQSFQDQIVAQLQSQGFTKIELSRTLLGRVRVIASSASLERELVFNPTTGEILRDYWEQRDSSSSSAPRVFDPSRDDDDNSDRSGKSDDDEDDADDEDDRDDGDSKDEDDERDDDEDDSDDD